VIEAILLSRYSRRRTPTKRDHPSHYVNPESTTEEVEFMVKQEGKTHSSARRLVWYRQLYPGFGSRDLPVIITPRPMSRGNKSL
jgi:hypothetical protein